MMTLLFSIVLSGVLWLAALPGFSQVFSGAVPNNLGVTNQQFAPCPDSPNCVSSQAPMGDKEHYIAPLTYDSERQTAKETIVKILSVVPRTSIVEQTDDYLRAESTSRLMGFVDDLEFYFPPNKTVIEWRSASRLGESDLGVNRRRLEQIRLALADLTA
ncbi:MAG: DUF1499 domain-containing protein [Synechocystis sp.]|nr:DUF1499 domain-containing protein [Synechocystis sp.]